MDENDEPRETHGLVLEGSKWLHIENRPDGSVELQWDATSTDETAKVLFGWKGGTSPQEINGWTHPPSELLLGPNVETITSTPSL